MIRLGLITPLDPQQTGVAEYSLDLLPHLAHAAAAPVTVFGSIRASSAQGDAWTLRGLDDLVDLRSQLDLLIYQMGNSPAHDFMYDVVHRNPGLLVLHDLSLHNFFARQAQRDPARYVRACGFAYDREGSTLARRYLRQPMPVEYPQYLVSESLAARHLAVIVHSQHAAAQLGERCPTATIHALPMLMPLPPVRSPEACRIELGIAPETYLIVVFGTLNVSKYPTEILDALQSLRADGVAAHVAFVGKETFGFQLAPEIMRRGLDAYVTQLGFVDAIDVQRWMFAADVAVGLRRLYFGETSASALRVLASGTPMIVTRIGAFDELPDDVCIKLEADSINVSEALHAALRQLYLDLDRRQTMGAAARDYVKRMHDPALVAEAYLDVVRTIFAEMI